MKSGATILWRHGNAQIYISCALTSGEIVGERWIGYYSPEILCVIWHHIFSDVTGVREILNEMHYRPLWIAQ